MNSSNSGDWTNRLAVIIRHAVLPCLLLGCAACRTIPPAAPPDIVDSYLEVANFYRASSELNLGLGLSLSDADRARQCFEDAVDNSRLHFGAVTILSAVHAARENDFDRAEGLSYMVAQFWSENAEAHMLRFLLGRDDETAERVTDMLAKLRVSEESSPYYLAMVDAMERIPIREEALLQFTPHQQSFLRFLQEVARAIDESKSKTPSDEPLP